MKRLVVLALAIGMFGFAEIAEAQDHDMGLEFGFNGLSTLGVTPVQAGQIGIKKAIGPDNYGVVRFGFGLSRDTDEGQPVGTTNFTDKKDGTTEFGVGIGVQHNCPACNGLVPYVGGLLEFGRSSTFDEPSVQDPPPAGTLTKSTSTTMSFGFTAMAGAEYFIRRCLSLSGEYTFGFSYSSTSYEWTYQGQASMEDKTKGFAFGPFYTAVLRLTAYWGSVN
jgi:opacity protein-like surface antigen